MPAKHKFVLGALIVILVLVSGILVIHRQTNNQEAKAYGQISSSLGPDGAAKFTQEVYNTYLKDWGKGESSLLIATNFGLLRPSLITCRANPNSP
jgi:hypothetical protein